MVAGRYQVWQSQILLDTQPGIPMPTLEAVPASLRPYLKLSDLPLAIPRPYAYLSPQATGLDQPLLLLEAGAIGTDVVDDQMQAFLLPTLSLAWGQATALRQLHWLRQIAALWFPLSQEGVALTLLTPDLLRVDQAALRLLALTGGEPSSQPITLTDLGQEWKLLVATAQPEFQELLALLAEQLITNQISDSLDLLIQIDQAIAALAANQPLQVASVTFTDKGPSRDRNEDACYPQPGKTTITKIAGEGADRQALMVVCDGIGGHEQGSVASQLAIATIKQHLHPLANTSHLSPADVTGQIKQAITAANDAIVARNDQESRRERGRMGTTVVLALAYYPYLYIAHLGDSRAYRISPHTCVQVTLDDDVASRETRQGYALYQEAIQMPSAGSLVQALGINDSGYLYPTVQQFPLDDYCLYLLCSDGLSDYDRIEMNWHYLIRPVITAQTPMMQAGQGLVDLANTLNGHDNVTVGLLKPAASLVVDSPPAMSSSPTQTSPTATTLTTTARAPIDLPVERATRASTPQQPSPQSASGGQVGWLLGAVATAILGTLAAGMWYRTRPEPPLALQPVSGSLQALSQLNLKALDIPPVPIPSDVIGSYWQVSQSTVTNLGKTASPQPTTLASPSPAPSSPTAEATLLPAGSIVRIVSRQTTLSSGPWAHLEVCSIPSGNSLAQVPQESDQATPTDALPDRVAAAGLNLAEPGDQGWLAESQLYQSAVLMNQLTATQLGWCSQ